MFTGIIEQLGIVKEITKEGGNIHYAVESALAEELHIDQSLAHDGVCLTVTKVEGNLHYVTAIEETLHKTALSSWQVGRKVNLERSASMNRLLDGHIVQGHVDGVGKCEQVEVKEGSWEYTVSFPEEFAPLIVEKGSICLNGISLTLFAISSRSFKVAIIPYTYAHTTMHQVNEGDVMNLEFDVLGKYVQRHLSLRGLAE